MPLSVIPLGPGMDSATRDNAINNNFRQIEAENRTKVIKDKEGKEQILIGQNPDGRYGIYIGDTITISDGVISTYDDDGNLRITLEGGNVIVRDVSGTRRILMGNAPDDGRSGLWVSAPGKDVIEELE